MSERDVLATALADRYVIDREIGRGGMATVYLARDVRHARPVALKLLSTELGAVLGAERFLSEIRVTANLQHPNLLPLFDSGEVDGLLYYVMPFVEGETLRQRIDREKQLPIEEAVRIAVAVANALDYAHRHGVIHRDLKPENILLHDGQPLVADFGIALAVSNAGGQRVTQTGLSLGTPQYMSPEQATGDRTIDGRTDIYSLGALTYEMLAGEPPHTGATAQAVIARLMTEEPRSLAAVRRNVPAHVEAAVRCALEKLPADRFATAKEFADALQGRGAALPATSAVAASVKRSSRVRTANVIMMAGLALIAAAATTAWWRAAHAPGPMPARFTVDPPAGMRIVGANGRGLPIALSPDGQLLAMLAGGESQLYLRRIDQLEARPVAGAPHINDLRFSPDSKSLAYFADAALGKISVAGGEASSTPTKLMDVGDTQGIAWTAGGDIIYLNHDSLARVSGSTGARTPILAGDRTKHGIWYLPVPMPDGKTVAVRRTTPGELVGGAGDRLALLPLGGGEPTLTDLEMQNVIGYIDGILVFGRVGGRVMAAPFDLARRKLLGDPVLMIDDAQFTGVTGVAAVLSATGTLAYLTRSDASQFDIVDDHGTVSFTMQNQRAILTPAWSPDGRRIAMAIISETGPDVWIYDVQSRLLSRLTQGGAVAPAWTPDGKRIGFTKLTRGLGAPYWIPADGSGEAEPIPGTTGQAREDNPTPISFTPDGKYAVGSVFASPRVDQRERHALAIPLKGGGPPLQILEDTVSMYTLSIAPNGKWVAYMSAPNGRPEVYVRPFPTGSGRVQISAGGGVQPRWSPDGRRLYYRSGAAFRAATLDISGAMPRVVRADSLFPDRGAARNPFGYDVSPDGKRFVVRRDAGEGSRVVVVTNWMTEVRAKLKR